MAVAPVASAAPWACDGAGYLTQFDNSNPGEGTAFSRTERQPDGTYQLDELGVNSNHLNAIGFRPQDGFMYGWDNTTQEVVRIEDDGSDSPTFTPMGNPVGSGITTTVVGAVLADGTYMVWAAGGGAIFDVSGPTAQLVTTITSADGTGLGGDFAVSPVDGELYAVSGDPSGTSQGVYRFDLDVAAGTLSRGDRVADAGGGGANWFEADGTFIQYNNSGGDIYASDFDTGAVTRLGPAPAFSNVDGASCPNGLALAKDAAPRTVVAGEEITYTHTITSRALEDGSVDFVDQLPPGLTFVPGGVTVTPALGAPNAYGGTGTVAISGTMSPQQEVTISARVRVSPDHACDVDVQNQSQATLAVSGLPPITTDSDDPTTPADPDDPTIARVTCAADLEVVKTAATAPVVPGEEASFELTVTNHGPSTSTGETVSDQLPDELSFVSASPGCGEANGTVTCAVGALAPGASRTFTVTGTVDGSLDHCLENTATVTGAIDSNTANNSSTVCAPIEGRVDLSIAKDPSRDALPAGGGQVMYTLVVENDGPSDATGVKVVDPMAQGLTLVAAEPSQGRCSTANGQLSCNLGKLVDGGSAQVLVTANAWATPGQITNTATVSGDQQETDPDNNSDSATVSVPAGPVPPPAAAFDLEVDKRASAKRPRIGQKVAYRIVVRNNGPGVAPAVTLTDTLNAPVRVVRVRSTAGSCEDRIPMGCELGDIAAGERVVVRVVVRHRDLGCRQINAASATGSGTDSDPANNMDTVRACVRKVLLRVTKVASSSNVRAGQAFGYRIRVKNRTRGIARRVRVCDRLPRGLVYVSSKPRAKLRKGRHCWTIKRLGPKKAKTFRVRVRALRGASGRKVNRVSARSPDAAKKGAQARRAVRVLGRQVAAGGVTG